MCRCRCRCRCRCCCRCRFRCPPCQSVVFVCLRENFHFRSGANNKNASRTFAKVWLDFCTGALNIYLVKVVVGGNNISIEKAKDLVGGSEKARVWVIEAGHHPIRPSTWGDITRFENYQENELAHLKKKTMHVVLPSGYSWISNVWHTENTYFCSWNVLNIFEITCPWKFRVTYIWSDISENHSFEESCPSKISLAISETNSLVWSKIKFDICVRHSISGRGQIKQKLFCRKETKWTLAPSSAGLSAMLSGLWDILSKIIKHQRRYGISQ